jgi:hypothetical protein
MTEEEIRDKVLKGCQLAIERLLEEKRKANGYIVISDNGKVIRVKASDIKTPNSASKS